MPRAVLFAAATFLVIVSTGAFADYRVQAGDVVEVSIAGLEPGGHRAPVQMDGSVTIPLAGTLDVAGATLAEMRDAVQRLISSKVLRLRAPDGGEYMRTVEPDEIAVSIVEYRPVFVTGSVTRPGEQAYRPFMTVRQALSAAGGQVPAGALPGAGDAISLQSDYVSTWLKLAAQHARVWRLKHELGEEEDLDASDLPASPVAGPVLASMVERERQLAALRQGDLDRRRSYLATAIAQADEQIATLTDQQVKEQEGADADAAELARATELLAKGSVTYGRVLENRRTVLLSSTRALQTGSQLMQVKRTRGEMTRELDEIDDIRRMDDVRELMDAELALNTERERLARIGEQLALAGLAAPRPASADGSVVTIHRRSRDGSRTSFEVGLDEELAPGDVVEFAVPSDEPAMVEGLLPEVRTPVLSAVPTTGAATR